MTKQNLSQQLEGITFPEIDGFTLTAIEVEKYHDRVVEVYYTHEDGHVTSVEFAHRRGMGGRYPVPGSVVAYASTEDPTAVAIRYKFELSDLTSTMVSRYTDKQMVDFIRETVEAGKIEEMVKQSRAKVFIDDEDTAEEAADAPETDPQPEEAPEATETATAPQTGTRRTKPADLRDYFDKAGITWPTVEGYARTMTRVDDEARAVSIIHDVEERTGEHDEVRTGVHLEVDYDRDTRALRASVGTHSGYVDLTTNGLRVAYRGFADGARFHNERAPERTVTRYSRRQMTDYVTELLDSGWVGEAIARAVEALNTTAEDADAPETAPQPDEAPEATATPQTVTTYVEPEVYTTPAREGDYPLGTVATVDVPGLDGSRGQARARRVSSHWFGERAMDSWQVLEGELAGHKFTDAKVVEVHQTAADQETAPEATEAAPSPETGTQAPETTDDDDADTDTAIEWPRIDGHRLGVECKTVRDTGIKYENDRRGRPVYRLTYTDDAGHGLLAYVSIIYSHGPHSRGRLLAQTLTHTGWFEDSNVLEFGPNDTHRTHHGGSVATYKKDPRPLRDILDEYASTLIADGTLADMLHESLGVDAPGAPETAPEPEEVPEATEAAPDSEAGSQAPETADDGDALNELTVMTDGHAVSAEYLEQVAHLQLPDDDALDAATVVLGESVVDVVYPTDDGETRYRVLPRGYQLAVYYLRPDGTGEALGHMNLRQRYTGHRLTAYAGRQLVDAFDGGLSRLIRDDLRWRAENRDRLAHVTDATPVESPADGILSHMVRAEAVR